MTLIRAVDAYNDSLGRAVLMTRLTDLANSTNYGTEEDHTIGYLLRVVWIAVHQGRVAELEALVTPAAEKWMDGQP